MTDEPARPAIGTILVTPGSSSKQLAEQIFDNTAWLHEVKFGPLKKGVHMGVPVWEAEVISHDE